MSGLTIAHLIRKEIDPKAEEARLRRLEFRKHATTFASVADDYIERHVKGQRKAKDTEREIRKELVARSADRPVTSIAREERDCPRGGYCSTASPVHCPHRSWACPFAIQLGNQPWHLWPRNFAMPSDQAHDLIGAKQPRQRTLNDAELRALWQASETIGYPFGPLYRLLLLTGARKSEVAGARWSEFDLDRKFGGAGGRFKSNATHLVPLSDHAVAVLLSSRTSPRRPYSLKLSGRSLSPVSVRRRLASTTDDPGFSPGLSTIYAGQFELGLPLCGFLTWSPRW